jgi:hypothetical protein
VKATSCLQWNRTAALGRTPVLPGATAVGVLSAPLRRPRPPPATTIAEWNSTGMTANLDELANKEGWDKVVAPELLPRCQPSSPDQLQFESVATPHDRWGAPSDMAKLFAPHRRSGPSLHAEALTFAWPNAIPDFKQLSYTKDTCISIARCPCLEHANYRIRPGQHGRADARLPDHSAQGGRSETDLSRDR